MTHRANFMNRKKGVNNHTKVDVKTCSDNAPLLSLQYQFFGA